MSFRINHRHSECGRVHRFSAYSVILWTTDVFVHSIRLIHCICVSLLNSNENNSILSPFQFPFVDCNTWFCGIYFTQLKQKKRKLSKLNVWTNENDKLCWVWIIIVFIYVRFLASSNSKMFEYIFFWVQNFRIFWIIRRESGKWIRKILMEQYATTISSVYIFRFEENSGFGKCIENHTLHVRLDAFTYTFLANVLCHYLLRHPVLWRQRKRSTWEQFVGRG